ncbi:MAG: hypothetical protein AB2809_18235 [Candidatus Thiodiazotropha sp.]
MNSGHVDHLMAVIENHKRCIAVTQVEFDEFTDNPPTAEWGVPKGAVFLEFEEIALRIGLDL